MKNKILTLTFLICLTNFTFGQVKSPNSYQDIKLGMTISEFQSKYPDAEEGTFWVFFTDIETNGMTFYSISKKTSSNDEVSLDIGFYKDKVAVFDVSVFGDITKREMLNALTTKYGKYSYVTTKNWVDWTNNQDRTTHNYFWNGNPTCLLIFNCMVELSNKHLVYADKQVQRILSNKKNKSTIKKIE